MTRDDHDDAMVRDLSFAGFGLAERRQFFAAIDKPPGDLTGADWALIARYDAVTAAERAA